MTPFAIRHRTTCRFTRPVAPGPHRLHLRPRESRIGLEHQAQAGPIFAVTNAADAYAPSFSDDEGTQTPLATLTFGWSS